MRPRGEYRRQRVGRVSVRSARGVQQTSGSAVLCRAVPCVKPERPFCAGELRDHCLALVVGQRGTPLELILRLKGGCEEKEREGETVSRRHQNGYESPQKSSSAYPGVPPRSLAIGN